MVLMAGLGLLRGVGAEGVSDWFVRSWQTQDGLPDNSISGIAQAPDGYLWLGTNGGPMRFNGNLFHPLGLQPGEGLPSRQVRTMLMDGSGRLWLGMERGPVIRVSPKSHRFFTGEDGVGENATKSMTEDQEGRFWVSYSGLVCRIEGDTVTRFEKKDGVPSARDMVIDCTREGQIWLASDGKLQRFEDGRFVHHRHYSDTVLCIGRAADTGLWLTVGSELKHVSKSGEITDVCSLPQGTTANALFEDREGAVWIGTRSHGLLRHKNGSVSQIETTHPWIGCVTEDHDGNIWAGTSGGGLNLVRRRSVSFIDEGMGLPFTSVRSTTCDSEGKLWAVSRTGELARQGDGEWQTVEAASRFAPFNCVATESSGRILAGTRHRGLAVFDGVGWRPFEGNDKLTAPFVRSLLPTRSGDLWIATDRPHRLHRVRDGEVAEMQYEGTFNAIRAMSEGADGTIWIGSSDGRLLRVSGDRLIDEEKVEDIPSIRTLHTTADGSLWIGYAGEGLGLLKDGSYSRFTTEDGLFDDYISQIQDDGQGGLWITANRGLFQVAMEELLNANEGKSEIRCRVFGRNDGLPSFQPSRDFHPDTCRTPDGLLYFSTGSGLVAANPAAFRTDSQGPALVIEQMLVDGRVRASYQVRSMQHLDSEPLPVDLGAKDPSITLEPAHDRISIQFAALSLASPENVGFRYRLSPLVKQWQTPEGSNQTTFTRLPAGRYKFELIACNGAGAWTETAASLMIVVKPFFWETWVFRTGLGVLLALAAGGLVYQRQRRQHGQQIRRIAAKRELEQERSRIARDIHDDLGANLTRISLLSQQTPTGEPAENDPVLEQIQVTARHMMRSMDEVVWAINPEHDTFDDLANYLSSYAQDFLSVAGIRCRLEMPLVGPDCPLSAQLRHNLFLAFKEALNNVVKYSKADEVRITLSPGEDAFVLRIEDDGVGINRLSPGDPSRSYSGSGLANMNHRMEEIGGSCTVESRSGEGTSLEFHVPLAPQS